MATSARIDGSLPDLHSATTGIIFTGQWVVAYDWVGDRVKPVGQPARLNTLSFPPPFDADLEGALRGQNAFAAFLYLFKDGQYLRIRQAGMIPDGPPASTASAWDLPPTWTALDAVFPGGGKKSGFAYFFRADEYCRFDWTTNKR